MMLPTCARNLKFLVAQRNIVKVRACGHQKPDGELMLVYSVLLTNAMIAQALILSIKLMQQGAHHIYLARILFFQGNACVIKNKFNNE